MPCHPPDPKLVEHLRRQIDRLERVHRSEGPQVVSSGCGALDEMLPEGGFRRGTLVEWLAEGEATGAGTLAMIAAREACRPGGALVVLDSRRDFCPTAALRLGIDAGRLLVVQTGSPADQHWALCQVLECEAVSAVVASCLEPGARTIGVRTMRRWQLAAERGGVLGLLLRPAAARHTPSWAEVRLLVVPLPAGKRQRRASVYLLRCRGGTSARSLDVEIDDEQGTVCLAAQLADPADRLQPARAS